MARPRFGEPPKPPYPDYDSEEVQKDSKFCGLVWYPTSTLRFIERQVNPPYAVAPSTRRILQQVWETRILNKPGLYGFNVRNPNYTQWRDVPLVAEE